MLIHVFHLIGMSNGQLCLGFGNKAGEPVFSVISNDPLNVRVGRRLVKLPGQLKTYERPMAQMKNENQPMSTSLVEG